ncbi:MAG TPA: sigma-54 dependent transcriptional regulator [Candidatus Krumholzibacteria bacterium]|nr:sigma-54 dependent transcriptional regulator [Candidatus Krumholzibacteria bacterium]
MSTVATKVNPLSILVVDDEPIVVQSLGDWFRQDGHRVDTAQNSRDALTLVGEKDYDLAFLDIKMPGVDGLELQSRLAAVKPDMTVIIMTAYASVDTAVRAMKAGAYDYIAKPFDPDELSLIVKRATEHRSLRTENLRLKEQLEAASEPMPIVGVSPAIGRVLELIRAVAATDATVLVKGESGTGKELAARAIHAASRRRYGPMVVVNCGALAEGLLESELFGHEKGAFTGAMYRHRGKFEMADGGTLFLDEIGTISPRVQVELLRVLEERVVTRVGGRTPTPVDFRVIAATNEDLEAAVARGDFREDLFWRLNVFTIEMPPLRTRPEDIVPLAENFLARYTRSMNRKPMRFSPGAIAALNAYTWPGNVRELQNAVERAVVVGTPPTIEAKDFPIRVTETNGPAVTGRSLANAERAHIFAVLEAEDWNISSAARVLEIDRGTLYHKIEKYGLEKARSAG